MTPKEKELAQLIVNQALMKFADEGDFASVAAALNSKSITIEQEAPVSMGDTGLALGKDAGEVLAVFESTAIGRSALAKLSADGLRYNHPLTSALLQGFVEAGALRPELSAKMTALSTRQVSPLEDNNLDPVGADELRTAWRSFRLDQEITNATASAKENITAEMSDDEIKTAWGLAWEAA